MTRIERLCGAHPAPSRGPCRFSAPAVKTVGASNLTYSAYNSDT